MRECDERKAGLSTNTAPSVPIFTQLTSSTRHNYHNMSTNPEEEIAPLNRRKFLPSAASQGTCLESSQPKRGDGAHGRTLKASSRVLSALKPFREVEASAETHRPFERSRLSPRLIRFGMSSLPLRLRVRSEFFLPLAPSSGRGGWGVRGRIAWKLWPLIARFPRSTGEKGPMLRYRSLW